MMKRRTFMIESNDLEKLLAIKARTGLAVAEQVRQGIHWWIESREWPVRRPETADRPTQPTVGAPERKQAGRHNF